MTKNMKNIGLIAGAIVLSLGLVAAVYMFVKQQPQTEPNPPASQGQVTLTGTLTCLPKKGDGPHTMECAYGLLSAGKYYGLDMSQIDSDLFNYTFDDQLKVSGELVEPEDGTTYAIEGTVTVDSIDLVSGAS